MRRSSAHSRPVFARWYGFLSRRAEGGDLGKRRRALVEQASGRLLDVGSGPGDTFKYVNNRVVDLVALDTDPAMLGQARRRVSDAPVPVRLLRACGERLPFPDRTFDTALAALVLCTVEDPPSTVAELHRVLRPGGRLLFMEHVRASDELLASWQDRLAWVWSKFNGGCRPNRATEKTIAEAGFSVVAVERYGFPALPHVLGVAVRS